MVTKGTTPGSIQQTLFMGASVIGFTAGLGWNEQSGQVVIQLVEDTASILADKFYLDAALQNQVWTGADPGFSKPTVGSAAMFKFGDFEFEGIVQSWKRLDSVDGNPTWEITLTDPREILAGTQLITGGYQGPILNNVANILNVYGFWESFGNRCPESLSGGFGGARTNEGGMPWNNILVATLVLTSNLPRQFNSYSPYGRLKFKDGGKDGFGAVSGDQYLVDLSLMPTAPPFYRLGGDSISLLEAISQVCQDGGSDFFVSLHFVHHNGELLKIIKLRTVSRRNIPTLGVIESFVSDHDGAVSKDVGRELRNEVNSAALIGGDIELIHEAFDNGLLDNDATFWPYWGLNSNNTPVIGVGLNDDHQFLADSTYLNMPEIGDSYLITVAELRAALAGQDIWETFMELGKKDIADALNIYPRWSASKIVANFGGSVSEFFPSDSNASQYAAIQKGAARKLDTSLLDKINILYSFVRAYATEFYGKKYLVRLPFVCAKRDSLTFEITYSVEVSNSGWTDFESGVAGLDTPALLDIFRDDQGKLTAFLGFTNVSNLDLSNLNPDDVAYEDDEIFIRCSVDEKIIFNNNTTFSYPRVVVTLPSLISLKSAVGDEPAIRRFIVDHVLKPSPLNNYQGIPLTPAESDILYKQLGELDGQGGYGALPVRPASAALPFKSNIGVYGPWFVSGSHGKVQFEKDESLVPWNFGGTTLMNVAGNDKIAQALTFMQESELGSIELPEPPTIFLGEELGSDFTWPIENRFLTLLPILFTIT